MEVVECSAQKELPLTTNSDYNNIICPCVCVCVCVTEGHQKLLDHDS